MTYYDVQWNMEGEGVSHTRYEHVVLQWSEFCAQDHVSHASIPPILDLSTLMENYLHVYEETMLVG